MDERGSGGVGLHALIQGSKDAAIAFAARRLINARLQAIGEVTSLSLDTSRHTAQLRIALRGESEALDVDVRSYHIARTRNRVTLTIGDAAASREWLTALLAEFAVGRTFHIQTKAAVLSTLLA